MVQLPSPTKIDIEKLIEYRFEGMLFHSMGSLDEEELFSFGTSKGKILSYKIEVQNQDGYDDDECYKHEIINDKDVVPT